MSALDSTLFSHVPQHPALPKPTKIVHIGHSYGSFLSAALLSTYGNLSSGAILTGFVPNPHATGLHHTAFNFEHAASSDPSRFSDRPSGYIVPGTPSGVQTNFFGGDPGISFTPEMLAYGDKLKQPNTVGEFVSIGMLNLGLAPDFRGPLQFVAGDVEYQLCEGDCKGLYDLDMLKAQYAQAKGVEVHLQPKTGHGLTLHENATAGYQVSLSFLARFGL